jgi:hypothetical protein
MLAAVGEEIQNNGPPSSALLALAMAQLGVVLLLRHRVRRWCEHPRGWAAVVGVNLVAMSLYLWHMVAALAASLVFWGSGLVSAAPPLSTQWWWQRPLWYLVCAVVLLLVVRAVRRFEWLTPVLEPVPDTRGRLVALGAGVALLAAGMVALTVTGLSAGPAGVSVVGLAAFVSGAVVVRRATGIVATTSLPRGRTRAPLGLS